MMVWYGAHEEERRIEAKKLLNFFVFLINITIGGNALFKISRIMYRFVKEIIAVNYQYKGIYAGTNSEIKRRS
jgi:hypothetical protein